MAAVTGTSFTVGKVIIRDKSLSSRGLKKKSAFPICIFIERIPYYKNHFDISAELLSVHYTFANINAQSQFFVPETTGGMIFKN